MLAGCIGSAVFIRQKIDELTIDFRARAPNFTSVGIGLRL